MKSWNETVFSGFCLNFFSVEKVQIHTGRATSKNVQLNTSKRESKELEDEPNVNRERGREVLDKARQVDEWKRN